MKVMVTKVMANINYLFSEILNVVPIWVVKFKWKQEH